MPGWDVYDMRHLGQGIHILPESDWIEHAKTADCICQPDIEYINDMHMFVHHSLDGREVNER